MNIRYSKSSSSSSRTASRGAQDETGHFRLDFPCYVRWGTRQRLPVTISAENLLSGTVVLVPGSVKADRLFRGLSAGDWLTFDVFNQTFRARVTSAGYLVWVHPVDLLHSLAEALGPAVERLMGPENPVVRVAQRRPAAR